MSKKVIIGIDLGTTYTCVAFYQNGKIEIIENKNTGLRTTPSIVTFTDNERVIGKPSRMSENTVYEIKRLIGRKFNDEHVQNDSKKWPFKIVQKGSKLVIEVDYKNEKHFFQPEQISAMILTRIKEIAELHLAQSITDAVITVPAYFNDSQRKATKDAAQIAGLNVLRIINEPTAAAIAYGFNKKITIKKNILVFDLGGGTFDVSIMRIEIGKFKVLAIGGDTHLGGCDFDNRLVEHFVNSYQAKHGKDISKNKKALYRLRNQCEIAKRALSETLETLIEIESLIEGQDFVEKLSRALFEQLNDDLFTKTIKVLEETLNESKLTKTDIDDIVLIGGSIRIPKIQSLIKEFFDGKEPFQNINPDEAVANGAAIQAAIIADKTNPDFIGLQIVDVTPLSLGICINGNIMKKIISRNTRVPCSKSEPFTTLSDFQKNLTIQVFEGERPLTKDNLLLGEFILEDIEIALKGIPRIEVTFTIDNDGILTVCAKDTKKLVENSIKINNPNGYLSQSEINQMIALAKKFQKDDKIQLEKVKAQYELEVLLSKIQKSENTGARALLDLFQNDRISREELIKLIENLKI